MIEVDPATPILVGVGQVMRTWDIANEEEAPSPLSLQIDAAKQALADTGASTAILAMIDRVVSVRINLDSIDGVRPPFGRCSNPPGTLAAELGISGAHLVYSQVGGDQPQALVNETAEAIFNGEAKAVLLAGSEAIAAMKMAQRGRKRLNWSKSVEGEFEDRGLGPALLSAYEIGNGFGAPTQTYPVFEQALRTRWGLDADTHQQRMAELFAGFSSVASRNPYAQYPRELSQEYLQTRSDENYPVADPYLKWHVAQDAVNQGAALILTSVGAARTAAIDPSRWVFLHGYASLRDRPVMERPDLSRSAAMEGALGAALEMAGRTSAEIDLLDLYSCFPCAVFIAAEALDVDWRARLCTVTGGLPFFGGAGNNYSMHAIATLADRLRAKPEQYGLILANGGFLSKEAVGIYSARPVTNWHPCGPDGRQDKIDSAPAPVILAETVEATVEAFTVTWKKGRPSRGWVLARTGKGRILARVRTGHRATLSSLHASAAIGRTVRISHSAGINYLEAADRLGEAPLPAGLAARSFRDVLVSRSGHLLEVTLNRPDAMNALHSGVHFELHEIWDSFEQDPDLWVAIITGAGDRAFCSGNDLKVTAKGGDMSIPPTGFAGLCNRFDRKKPVIAAVNGVAMGGGLEIILASDLAVAADSATFALPEVKVGLYAAAGGVQRLTRQIGRKAAMEMILTGKRIDAAQALGLGIINRQVAAGEAMAAARALASDLLQNSPSAIQASKEALNELEQMESLDQALSANGRIFGRLMRTHDFHEGVTAFAEKRSPRWTGS